MIKVYCEDSLLGLEKIPDKSVDLVLTDPPYEIRDLSEFFTQFTRVLRSSGSMYIFGDKNIIAEFWFSQLRMPHKELLVWHYKNSPKPRGRWRMSMQAIIYAYFDNSVFNEDEARIEYQPSSVKLHGRLRPSSGRLKSCEPYDMSKGALPRDVIEHPALLGHLSKERYGHPDQKPIGLIEKLIKTSSNEGDVVLDAFAGTGTTAIACINTKRKCIAFEKDEYWYSHIMKEINYEKENF